MDERIEKLKELIKTQCSSGNWDWDPYMHGMANGMLLSLSVMTGEEPEFMEPPEVWLADSDNDYFPAESCPHDTNESVTKPYRG